MENKTYNESILEIKKTNNYDLFKTIRGNRMINEKNYRKLLASIKEEQLIIPILVNEKYEIIDGQHRFFAASTLGLPVYYYMVPGYNIQQVKKANMVGLNWSVNDYMQMHIDLGNEHYKEFDELRRQFDVNFSAYRFLEIISVLQHNDFKRLKSMFEDGLFRIDSKMELFNFIAALEDFNFFKEYKSIPFVKAFIKLYTMDRYDHGKMKRKLTNQGYKIEKRPTIHDYLHLLVNEIYTFGSSKPEFRYDVHVNRFYEIG